MEQENKQLLFKDLCMRLPYGVICQMEDKLIISESPYYDCTLSERYIELFRNHKDFYIKPYLRTMSSMTEEEKESLLITLFGKNDTKYFKVSANGSIDNNDAAYQDLSNFIIHWIHFDGINTSTYIDWLNKNHFDYRGLIPKGLAIKVTEENNPYR